MLDHHSLLRKMRIATGAARDWMRVLSFVDAKHGGAADALTERRDATAGRDMKTVSQIKETKVMRTSVDLGDTRLQALDELSRKEKRSRAAAPDRLVKDAEALNDHFGLARALCEQAAFYLVILFADALNVISPRAKRARRKSAMQGIYVRSADTVSSRTCNDVDLCVRLSSSEINAALPGLSLPGHVFSLAKFILRTHDQKLRFARVTTGNIAELAATACSLALPSARTIG